MSDPLLRATRALREKYEADDAAERDANRQLGGRERVLDVSNRSSRRRRQSRMVLLTIAAAFLVLASWAAATGALRRALEGPPGVEVVPSAPRSRDELPGPASPAPLPSRPPGELPAEAEQVQPARAPPASAATASPPSAAGERAALPRVAASLPLVAAQPSAGVGPSAVDREDERLYAQAHRAHFEDRDFARALTAWDGYLAQTKSGRLAVEARYNRALCLLRLGRRAEGKVALAPFANGEHGGYRRTEAQRLIEAIDVGAVVGAP